MRNKSVILGHFVFRDDRVNTELESWGVGVRVLHWLTVAVLAVQIATALAVIGGPGMTTMPWLPWHASLGFAILAIVALRIAWRLVASGPDRPHTSMFAILRRRHRDDRLAGLPTTPAHAASASVRRLATACGPSYRRMVGAGSRERAPEPGVGLPCLPRHSRCWRRMACLGPARPGLWRHAVWPSARDVQRETRRILPIGRRRG
ncbi:MAG: cytochrome b/b6 domain-containing protein [Rhizobiales bacterium]|nr:cytochrome b/b6 domain-containing protein [Hyphomicrobiales bacterium]